MQGAPEPTIARSDSEECFEKQVTTTMAGALFSVLSRLPATWRARRRARRIAANLPDYAHTVPLPDSDTIHLLGDTYSLLDAGALPLAC